MAVFDGHFWTRYKTADGLVNGAEAEWGTSPQDRDSDGDGIADGVEVGAGSNPTDQDSMPQDPELVPSHARLVFTVTEGQSRLLEKPVLLTSRSPGDLQWTAAAGAPWISVDTKSGRTPSLVNIGINRSFLSTRRCM